MVVAEASMATLHSCWSVAAMTGATTHSCSNLGLDARSHYALVLEGVALVLVCGRGVEGRRALVLGG